MAYESGQRDRRAAYPDQPPSLPFIATIASSASLMYIYIDTHARCRCMDTLSVSFFALKFWKEFFFFGYKAVLTMGSRFERRRREMCKRETNACQRGMTKAYIQRHRKKVHYFERNLYTRKRGKRRRNLLHFHAYRIVFKNPPKNGGGENNMKKRNST